MINLILQFKNGEPTFKDIDLIKKSRFLKILDKSSSTFLVEIENDDLQKLENLLSSDWRITKEKRYAVPDSRKKLK